MKNTNVFKLFLATVISMFFIAASSAFSPYDTGLIDYMSFGDLGRNFTRSDRKDNDFLKAGSVQADNNAYRGNLSLHTLESNVLYYVKGGYPDLEAYSFNFWINHTNNADSPIILKLTNASTTWYMYFAAGKIKLFIGAVQEFSSAPVDTKMMITLTTNASGTFVYKDGARVYTGTSQYLHHFENYNIQLLGYDGGQAIVGAYDEWGFWNRTLTDDEITELYAPLYWNGSISYPGAGPSFTPTAVPLLIDVKTMDAYPASSFNEFSKFFIGVNFTNSITPPYIIKNASCISNMSNITYLSMYNASTNYTFNSANQQLTVIFDDNNVSAVNDSYRFRLCKNSLGGNMRLLADNKPILNISAADIPACPVYVNYFANFNQYTSRELVNYTLTCLTCTATKTVIAIRQPNITLGTDILTMARKYIYHNESTIERSGYYINDDDMYSLRDTGNFTVKGYCMYNVSYYYYAQTFEITGNARLTAVIINLGNDSYINNMTIESAASTRILGGEFGGIAVFMNMTVTNYSGFVIKTALSNEITLNSSELPDGDYNISYVVADNEGIYDRATGPFHVKDTTKPMISITQPAIGASVFQGESVSFAAEMFDINLYRYAIIIKNMDNGSIIFNQSGFTYGNTSVFNYTSSFSGIGNYNFSVLAADAHTGELIAAHKVYKDASKLVFDDNVVISANSIAADYSLKEDRYNFGFTFAKGAVKKEFTISSRCQLEYLKDSRYKAHFISWCGFENSNWIDFEGESDNYFVEQLNGSYKITFNSEKESMQFSSFGELNTAQEDRLFTVRSSLPYSIDIIKGTNLFNTDAINTDSNKGVMLIFLLIAIFFAMMIIGLYFRIIIVLLLTMFYGLFMGMFISTVLSSIVGFLFIVFALVVGIVGFLNMNSR